jgi:hypothetical protein
VTLLQRLLQLRARLRLLEGLQLLDLGIDRLLGVLDDLLLIIEATTFFSSSARPSAASLGCAAPPFVMRARMKLIEFSYELDVSARADSFGGSGFTHCSSAFGFCAELLANAC